MGLRATGMVVTGVPNRRLGPQPGEVRATGANAVGCVTESSIGLFAQGVTESYAASYVFAQNVDAKRTGVRLTVMQ